MRATRGKQQPRELLGDAAPSAHVERHVHHEPGKQARFLTSTGADSMAAARETCDALELTVSDELWPLPKYREMLFPV